MKRKIWGSLLLMALVVPGMVGCSAKPYVMYEPGSIDEADVVQFDISVDRTTVFIDGKKIAIRHSMVHMAPGSYTVKVVANPSFDRKPEAEEFDKIVTNLKARGVPFATMTERPNSPIEVELTFEPEAGQRYALYADLIMRPMPKATPREQLPPAEFIVWIEHES